MRSLFALLALLVLTAVPAFATPSPALVNLLKNSYDPNVTFFHTVEKNVA